jgi:hypothetical protein
MIQVFGRGKLYQFLPHSKHTPPHLHQYTVRAERGIAECENWWHVGLLIQRATMLLYITMTYRRRPVNEELKDLAGFSHNTPVSCLLSSVAY